NSSGSSADRMLPALTQEMACSLLRPPNTTATRVLRGLTAVTLPPRAARRGPTTNPNQDRYVRHRARGRTARCRHEQRSWSVAGGGIERGGHVGDQILGVLQATGEAYQPFGGVVAPLGAPVGRGVGATEGRGHGDEPG